MSEHSNPTQNQRVLEYMEKHGGITQLEALTEIGVMRLASRISDLKRRGYPITSRMQAVKNRYGETCHVKRYSMEGQRNG